MGNLIFLFSCFVYIHLFFQIISIDSVPSADREIRPSASFTSDSETDNRLSKKKQLLDRLNSIEQREAALKKKQIQRINSDNPNNNNNSSDNNNNNNNNPEDPNNENMENEDDLAAPQGQDLTRRLMRTVTVTKLKEGMIDYLLKQSARL